MKKLAIGMVVVMAAGCLGNPAVPPVPTDTGTLPLPATVLYVSAERFYFTGGITLTSMEVGYATELPNVVRVESTDLDGTTTTRRVTASGPVGLYLPPLPAAPTTPAAINTTLDTLTAGFPAMPDSSFVSFLLSAATGSPGWTISSQPKGSPPQRYVANPTTLAPATAGSGAAFPSVPSLDVADFAFHDSRAAGDAAAHLWASDAFLVDGATSELGQAGVNGLPFQEGGAVFLILPDLEMGDGLAPTWFLQYYSPARGEMLRMAVHAMGVVMLGDVVPARWPAEAYRTLGGPSEIVDSTDAVAYLKYKYAAFHQLQVQGSQDVWSVRYFRDIVLNRDSVSHLAVDGATGDLIYCEPEIACQ